MEKKVVQIRAVSMELRIGEPATVVGMDGRIYRTSPVVSYVVSGLSNLYRIETEHTVYVI